MSKKILFIVEGERDGKFASSITNAMNIDIQVFRVKANIYMLYNKLKKEDFQLNITDTLIEMNGVSQTDKEMLKLQSPFLYTYLLFDMDPQHSSQPIYDNISIVKEMLDYFDDETDNTIGKLYINYPMLESLWDYDKLNIDSYRFRNVAIKDIPSYKRIVGERGTPMNTSKYSLSTYKKLGLINIKKAMYIVNDKWLKPSYKTYIQDISQTRLLSAVKQKLKETKHLYVCNSLPFFMVDYWGNANGFYDSL